MGYRECRDIVQCGLIYEETVAVLHALQVRYWRIPEQSNYRKAKQQSKRQDQPARFAASLIKDLFDRSEKSHYALPCRFMCLILHQSKFKVKQEKAEQIISLVL